MKKTKATYKSPMTQNEKYSVVPFSEMEPSTFFNSNGMLCIKINDKEYARIDTVKKFVEIVEWDKHDFQEATVVDIQYWYQKRKPDAVIKE
jgi:hypothetical protein